MKLHLEMTGDGPARWLYPQVPAGMVWQGLPDLLYAATGFEEHPHYVEKTPDRTFVRVGILSQKLQADIDEELKSRRVRRELEEQEKALAEIPKPGLSVEELEALPNAIAKLESKLEDPDWLIGIWEGFNQIIVVTSTAPPQILPKWVEGFPVRVITDSKLVPFPKKK